MIENIISGIVTIVLTPLINKALKDHAKLIGYYGHRAKFKVKNQIDGCGIKIMCQYSEADFKTWKDNNKIGDICFVLTNTDGWNAFLLKGNKAVNQVIIEHRSPIYQYLESLKTKKAIEQKNLNELREILQENILFPATMVHTHSVVIRNTGRKSLTNVRLGHFVLPDFYLYQDVEYSKKKLPDGGEEICFPVLAPKDALEISYLYFAPFTYEGINSWIKADECVAKIINVLPVAILPKWKNICLFILLMIGIAAPTYLIVLFIIKSFF